MEPNQLSQQLRRAEESISIRSRGPEPTTLTVMDVSAGVEGFNPPPGDIADPPTEYPKNRGSQKGEPSTDYSHGFWYSHPSLLRVYLLCTFLVVFLQCTNI